MVKNVFSTYPMLNENHINLIGYDFSEIKFYARTQYDKKIIEISEDSISDNLIILKDENSFWDINSQSLSVVLKMEISNSRPLFNKNGIANSGASIGLAIQWYSRESMQRGIVRVGTMDYFDNNHKEYQTEINFEVGQLRGDIVFQPFLYIEKASRQIDERSGYLQNNIGSILGGFTEVKIVLDGDGSEFPIYIVSNPNGPLWQVDCQWDDPVTESFSRSVAIRLNQNHPGYKYIDRNSKKFDQFLINDIVASSICIIITKISQSAYANCLKSNGNFEIGSVAHVANYFIQTFGLKNYDDLDVLSSEVRQRLPFDR
ncbi:hypothetical protein EPJ90_04400 [Erysipelothrix sp. strain 2 (EsS2-7-Brazil)]|uniref:hypothetical protein n=1 Tax=Erysipelothrix sp. strain 2 (EsS2-7-Brazil) TaxID=2500579 RepID=UPI00190E1291|nr:hypothetical protein [Erysipelothrix sp. strain 2 (EsS2-7-Brazil)]MBK2404080.1 hypothetical protein [Erysipelothrix sp. strain 2 (EsS2-7-Brazil)]